MTLCDTYASGPLEVLRKHISNYPIVIPVHTPSQNLSDRRTVDPSPQKENCEEEYNEV